MDDYARIAEVIRYITEHRNEQPDIKALASVAGLSPAHFHGLFSRWAGISPSEFVQALTLEHARRLLSAGVSGREVSCGTGLSGPARQYEPCISLEAASPGEIQAGGAGWVIRAGIAASPFGDCLVAECPRGICHLSFGRDYARLVKDWPNAEVVDDEYWARELCREIFKGENAGASAFHRAGNGSSPRALKLFLRGTAFQLKVWRALLQIPAGRLVSYGRLSGMIGNPNASRAVGSAAGCNPIGYLIPCHRVIRSDGGVGGYAWGVERKYALLARETAGAL